MVFAIARIRRRSRWRDPSLWRFRSRTLLNLRRTNVRPSSTRLTAISALGENFNEGHDDDAQRFRSPPCLDVVWD
jgi:hypothetical protein